jgi:20S proteasome alpha/beta subunit
MTVIVGLLCEDGIVVASDSQESDEGMGMKRLDVTKIYDTGRFGFDDAEIVLGGTGSAALIARAAELIEEKGFAPHFTTPRSVATIVEDAIGEMGERYGGGEDGLDLELLVGVFCKNCPKAEDEKSRISPVGLYSVYPPEEDQKVGVAEAVTDYTAMGTGGLFARYLLNRLHDEEHPTTKLSMEVAIREAVYVIEEVKKVDLWCGGPTQLLCITRSGDEYVLEKKKPAEIKQIADDLAADDATVKNRQREILLKTNATSPTKITRQPRKRA